MTDVTSAYINLNINLHNYRVTELEVTGLLANIEDGFEQKYFKVIVGHKVINYMVKFKHKPSTTCPVNLLLKIMEYTFDLRYLEGNKLKLGDTL